MTKSVPTHRILVVDDDEQVRKFLFDALSIDGYEVDVASDAERALHLLLTHRYAALVTDLDMPAGSGILLVREVRARGLRLPILGLHTDQEGFFEALIRELGRAEILRKPLGLGELREATLRLLALQKTGTTDRTPRSGRAGAP